MEQETEAKWEPYVHGVRATTGPTLPPLKHVNMFRTHFTQEKIAQAVQYLKSNGEGGSAPIFVIVDTRGEWTTEGGTLFWQASDGSTGRLQVVPQETVDEFIESKWYQGSSRCTGHSACSTLVSAGPRCHAWSSGKSRGK